MGVALDVVCDVLLANPAEVAGPGRAYRTQELAKDRQMTDDGLCSQASFILETVAERLEYLLMRG